MHTWSLFLYNYYQGSNYLQSSVLSDKDFINGFMLAIFSKSIIINFSSVTESQYSMNYDRIFKISLRNSYSLSSFHCLMKMVMSLIAYYFGRFFNLGYIFDITTKNDCKSASSICSFLNLVIFMIDFRESSWI